MRINRFLSSAGAGSRRAVESLVRAGRVRVNGRLAESLSLQIDPSTDRVELDGRALSATPAGLVYAYHKPIGVICSFRRQGSSPCLSDVLPPALRAGRLFHVGRLDKESSGLLLLTDDGALAQAVLHPSHPVWKEYHVEIDGTLSPGDLAALRQGSIVLDGRPCAPARVVLRRGARTHLSLWLREGRNRQVRRMLQAVGRRVLGLHRVAIGPLRLGDLPAGQTRPLTSAERTALLRGHAAPTPTGRRRDRPQRVD